MVQPENIASRTKFTKNKRHKYWNRCFPQSCFKENGQLKIEPLQSWLQLLAIFLMNAILAVPESTFGIFYDPLVDKYDVSRASLGWASSILYTTAMVTGIVFYVIYMYTMCTQTMQKQH